MTQQNQKRKRVMSVVLFPMIGLAMIPVYQYGRPWVSFHQQNLVIYDFRINSVSAPVGASHEGLIAEVYVQTGQKVQIGDIVAKLNTSQLEIKKRQAEVAIKRLKNIYAAEKSTIEKSIETLNAKQEALASSIQVAHSETQAIHAELAWIEEEATKIRQLKNRGSASSAELDQVLRELDKFKAQKAISRAKQSVAELELGSMDSQIAEAKTKLLKLKIIESEIEIAEAQLVQITDQLDKATIKAHCTGTVSKLLRGPGSSIKVGDPILLIQDADVWGEAFVDESKLWIAARDSPVQVTTKAFPDIKLQGRVVGIMPHQPEDQSSRQQPGNPILQRDRKICVRIKLGANDLNLAPGMTGQVVIQRPDSH